MKRILYYSLAFFLLVFHSEKSSAQFMGFIDDAKTFVGNITGFIGYDTTYVAAPPRPWKIGLETRATGFDVYNSNTLSDIPYQSFRSSRTHLSFGVDASYKGLGFGFSINPKKASQNNKKEKNFNFSYYCNRFCIDAMYNYSPSVDGKLKIDDDWLQLPKNVLKQKNLLISSYYIFNNKQFSYPAAFKQGFIQKKSAGSPLAILLFSLNRFNINPWESLGNHITESKLITFCAGAGYGYNFVTPHAWLIHLSSIPAVSFLNVGESELDNVKTPQKPHLNAMLTQRFAVVKYFANNHMFVNFTAYGIGLLASKDLKFAYAQVVWDSRVKIGVLF